MRNAGLEEAQAEIKIAGRNINNLRYADDTTLTAESEEQLNSLLIKVKEESEKVGLKLNIQKMNTGNYFSSRWPNLKGHLGPSQLTTGPSAALHTADRSLCETLRPLILMRPDLQMPWRSLVFFSRLSSLHTAHFPPG